MSKSGHTVLHVVDKSYNYYNVIVFSSDSIFQKAHFYAHNTITAMETSNKNKDW